LSTAGPVIPALTAWTWESATALATRPNLQQAVGEILRNGGCAPDAVDLDPLRLSDQLYRFGQSFRGRKATCLVQRRGVSGKNVVGDGRRVIAAMEVR
jgi:hypothetical protein